MTLEIDKESALIYIRMAEKLVLLTAKYANSRSIDNIIREKNYYAHIVKNPPETPLAGITTYAGLIKNIPFHSEPTIAIMFSGKGSTIDSDFYLKPLEIYYIIEDEIKEVSEDAGISINSRGFKYTRPRVGEPVVELAIDTIEKLAMLLVLELKKMVLRK